MVAISQSMFFVCAAYPCQHDECDYKSSAKALRPDVLVNNDGVVHVIDKALIKTDIDAEDLEG